MSTEIVKSFKQDVQALEQKMLSLIDKQTLEREVSFAIQAISASAQLQKCTRESLQKAVYNIALTGLSLNPITKLAYLIPRYTGGQMIAVLDPSYQGLVNLLTDCGVVAAVEARVVNQGDDFEVNYGTTAEIIHKPKFSSRDPKLVYAVATMPQTGLKQFEVMTIDEVNDIRDKSESYKAFTQEKIKSCIWVDHYNEMAKKTVIKRLYKYLPKSGNFEKVAKAIDLSNSDYSISDGQSDYLVQLIEKAGYDDDTKRILVSRVYEGISSSEYESMKKEAEMNRMDPITAGENYGQKEIKEHLAKLPG